MLNRRLLSTLAAVVAVGLCALVVFGMAHTLKTRPSADSSPLDTPASIPAQPSVVVPVPDATTSSSTSEPTTASTIASAAPPSSAAATVGGVPAAGAHAAAPAATPAPSTSKPPAAPPPATGQSLPLNYSTGSASQVITVVAGSTFSTTATLQAWDRAPGGGWLKHGGAMTAHVGSAGLTSHASESLSATPIGSFALNRAFGTLANPGTGLTYRQTSPADWWISQAGSLYNTMQTCSGSCSFAQGDPNEHLYYVTPQYNYAVVIEYNTGPVVQGAGSAFFLHVSDGGATAGCVSIPQANLVAIMQWLSPSAAPRILIGIG